MAHRRSGFAKKIDTVHWTYAGWTFAAQAAGTVATTLFVAQHLPETLMRIRGEVCTYLDGLTAPGKQVDIGIGIIQVPEGTGTTVLWSPITDGDAPWIWVDYACIGYEEYVTDVIDAPGLFVSRRVIDNKSMRKLRNTEVQVVLENATGIGAGAVNLVGNLRMLAGS